LARRRGDRAAALAYFEAAAAAEPNNVPAKLETAIERRDRGLYDEARSAIDAAIQLEPGNVHAKLQRGYIERLRGNRSAACDVFREISESHPDFLQASVELAIEERTLGRPGTAEQILKQVLKTQPDHLSALLQLAESARHAGDLEQCLSTYQRALQLNPGNVGVHVYTSQALNDCGDNAGAFKLLDTAASLFGDRWEIVRKRAELLRQAGYLHDARQLSEAAWRREPDNYWLRSHCIQFDLLLGDLEAAAAKLQGFSSDIISERARILVFHGQIAEAQYRLEEAREHYHAAVILNPQDGLAHAEMFRICMLLLRIDEARSHLEAWTRLNSPALIARGKSTGSSQSHMGQLYGEFALDKDLIDQLAGIRILPPKDRIAPLQALLRSNADHTASAIQLIVAMRQAQLLNSPQAQDNREGFAPIPKVIVQYWDDPTPPQDVTSLMETWRLANYDFHYRLFDDSAAREFLVQNYAPHVLRAYRRAGNPAEKADLFRLAYLYARGGIYVDADDRCLAPINSVLPSHVALVVYQEDYAQGGLAVGTLGNNFLAATPNNAVIGRALELAAEALNRGDTDVVWLKTGPALITRAFAEIASKTPLALSAWLKNIAVLQRNQLTQLVAIHCSTAYKKTDQHWSNTLNRSRRAPMRS
jgi:mannosyltransferase OCH1-like enzyme/predicted Zn-dependent protease